MGAPSSPKNDAKRPHLGWSVLTALRLFFRDGGADLSAAVGFYSLMSLPPLVYLTGVALSWAFRGTATAGAVIAAVSGILPSEVIEWLSGFDLGLDTSGELVVLALPALFWAANRGFSALGRAVNVAFGIRRMRAAWLARAKGLALVSAWIVFLIASIAAGTIMPHMNTLLEDLGQPHLSYFVEKLTALAIAPAISLFTFLSFYRFLPYCKVTWRSAAWGAGLTWILWEIARRLFGVMLSLSNTLGLVSGTLAGIITFLLWIYTTVAIVLLGAEYVAVLDGHRDPRSVPARASGPAAARPT